MKFRLLLWYMARRMDLLARTNAEFIAKLHGRDFVLQITSDENVSRYFQVRHNRVLSHGEKHPEPDCTLHFTSNAIGLRLLAKGDTTGFMTAMQTGEVQIAGDMSLLMWLMGIGKYLRPGRRGRGAPASGARAAS